MAKTHSALIASVCTTNRISRQHLEQWRCWTVLRMHFPMKRLIYDRFHHRSCVQHPELHQKRYESEHVISGRFLESWKGQVSLCTFAKMGQSMTIFNLYENSHTKCFQFVTIDWNSPCKMLITGLRDDAWPNVSAAGSCDKDESAGSYGALL